MGSTGHLSEWSVEWLVRSRLARTFDQYLYHLTHELLVVLHADPILKIQQFAITRFLHVFGDVVRQVFVSLCAGSSAVFKNEVALFLSLTTGR